MGIVITIAVLAVVGFFVYTKGIKPAMSGKLGEAYTQGQAEFEGNREKIMEEYFADRNRFGMFKEVIPDERIIGIASYAEPKTIGKTILEEVKTSATGIRKVNMALYFLAVTDKNLHAIGFDGENSFEHTVFDLGEITDASIGKAGGLNLKDQITGQNANLDKLKFMYKGKEYSFNLYRMLAGYPRFEVEKNFGTGDFERILLYNPTGTTNISKAMMTKEYYVEFSAKDYIYKAFAEEMKKKLNVSFPA